MSQKFATIPYGLQLRMETKVYKVSSPDDSVLETVGQALKNGAVAAIPTETVYGLAANALDKNSAEKIFAAKGRPADNPLIVHISELSQWETLVREIPQSAKKLAESFWPGPLTIILPKSEAVPLTVSGGLDTVGVRMPSHPIARAVIEKAGVPLAAPSANVSGRPSPTNAKYVLEDMDGKIEYIIDGGECGVGVESTVLTLENGKARILRPGAVTAEMIEAVLGQVEIDSAVYQKLAENAKAASPGMKYKHYSPNAQIIIVKGSFESYKKYVESHADENTAALCFEEDAEKLGGVRTVVYGKEKDPHSQAARIFDALREVDESGAKIAYARFPDTDGIGLAVFNRLVRAAAFQIIEVSL